MDVGYLAQTAQKQSSHSLPAPHQRLVRRRSRCQRRLYRPEDHREIVDLRPATYRQDGRGGRVADSARSLLVPTAGQAISRSKGRDHYKEGRLGLHHHGTSEHYPVLPR